MTQRDNILQELNDLQSPLANVAIQNIYQVPVGYFEGLADQLLNRVKALETENAVEELNYLSPFLSSISKRIPYSIPAGYFESLSEKAGELVATSDQSPAEELERLSPLLSGLKKEMPFSVPAGYFENFSADVKNEIKPAAKVVSITRQKWFRYAAAAVFVGFVAMIGLLLMNKEKIDPVTQSSEWVKKNLKKVSPDEIDSFVQMVDAGSPVVASNETKEMSEVRELIKDIPDNEIQNFLDETQTSVTEEDNSDDLFVN